MRSTTADMLWDEVWAEYDARQVAVARPMARVAARAKPRSGLARWALRGGAALLALGLGAYAAAPVLAAQHFAQALEADDPEALAARVDWGQLEAGLAGSLRAATHALPPGRTGGLTPGGLDYLQGMAREVAAGIASTDGLAETLRRRLGLENPRASLPPPRLEPRGLTQARVVLDGAEGEGGVALTLALTDPLALRWQVVAVELGD